MNHRQLERHAYFLISLKPEIRRRSAYNLISKKACSLICLFLIGLLLFIPVMAAAGPLEIRIGKDTLHSFIDAAFPLTIQQEFVILGAVKVPVAVTLSNPGKLQFDKRESAKTPALTLAMDFDVTSSSGLIQQVRGRVNGSISISLSQEQEDLLLAFQGIQLDISPLLKLFIAPLSKPVKVPLPKTIPIKIQDNTVYGRFQDLSLTVDGEVLIVKGQVYFSKKPDK
ncbi:MAG: hypothetical protein WCJ37_04370 [Syntrophus sp. (in: bacteria)]